jgi:hypothetical protein
MKKTVLFLMFVLSFSTTFSTAYAVQPNPQFTPGALCTPDDPDFAGYRYSAHIAYCNRNVSHAEKLQVAAAYGIPESEWGNYEFDHLIPLNAGGTSQAVNIWPQPIAEAHEKDRIEQATYNGLNNGTLTQEQAIQMIRDWIAAH